MNNFIFLKNKDFLYLFEKQPYESDEDTYDRLWWIINNNKSINNINDISDSIKYINEKYGMSYLT
jgi:hypothetical protein